MIYFVGQGQARLCNNECLEEYEQDIVNGFDYQNIHDTEKDEMISWEEGSIKFNFCAYCSKTCS